MRLIKVMGFAALGMIGFVGCADEQPIQGAKGIKIAVAPLELPGIGFACYDILVENATGPVWSQGTPSQALSAGDTGTICSTQYGNIAGGDITYIGPCDATSDSDNDSSNGVQNSVTLWVDGLYNGTQTTPVAIEASASGQNWQNPCNKTGTNEGCQLDFDCNENEDTLVEFNFTIMRDANQGFFDIAVNFEDVFCSAKVDCKYATGEYIRLVHGTDGVRTATAVAAFACTDGAANSDTHLYATNLVIDCGGNGTTTIPVNAPGNVDFNGGTAGLGNPDGPVEAAIVFMGDEQVTNTATGADAGKLYWNVAVGFEESGTTGTPVVAGLAGCTLKFAVTASGGDIDAALAEANVTYPYINASVTLASDTAFLCAAHPVNGDDGVSTVYTELGDALPGTFAWDMTDDNADGVTVVAY